MRSLTRVLIANRGEIARRIMRTCHAMGLETVAVFSDADAHMPFVREADQAFRLGPAPSRESYLVVERILDAARLTGADAIHPGYGFLAENADFARSCMDAGLIFVGPQPHVIRTMGSKIEAKSQVSKAGVPIVPGYFGDDQSDATLLAQADAVGYPLMIKASAGGGGKGMRIVREAAALPDAIGAARREAMSAFGDDALMLERYVENPRHVEIQILGDEHGQLVHLFERECSIQRRHQKIIEETPSVALDDALRDKMGAAAVTVGKTIGYSNAGTVEFILAPSGEFFFLEVNTRLQVEHPITECVTGLDLVREQLRVARGEHLGYTQEDLSARGAAVECRVYAEDPGRDFLPSTGRLLDWHLPVVEGLRVDAGVETGVEVGIHYDPMLAKLITYAPTRLEATQKMVRALRGLSVFGVTTNREFLLRILEHPVYLAGELDTHFIDTHMSEDMIVEPTAEQIGDAARVLCLVTFLRRRQAWQASRLPQVPAGFRNNPVQHATARFTRGGQTVEVAYRALGDGRLWTQVGEHEETVQVVAWHEPELRVAFGSGLQRSYRVVTAGERHHVFSAISGRVLFESVPRFPDLQPSQVSGGCAAPMPGQVINVLIEAGQDVEAGAVMVILEAMKMEHSVKAPYSGRVETVAVKAGDQVDADQLLVVVTPADDA